MGHKIWEQLVRKELGVDPHNRREAFDIATERFCRVDLSNPANRFLVEKLKIILTRMPDYNARRTLHVAWRRHKVRHA